MNNHLLSNVFIFLASAALIVPLASRFKLGSVLGYLIIGALIGPYGFKLIGNPSQIMHFAEFGVIMMLFLIGLELEPATLWRLRKMIVGLGSLQVVLTSTILCLLGLLFGYRWQSSLAVSMALTLSSTALVIQMLEEKNLLKTAEGETSFAVLLFQDIAVIPILIIMPLLAAATTTAAPQEATLLALFPSWAHPFIVASVIGTMIIAGHFFSSHLFFIVARTHLREVFTATSLALIVGITLLMEAVGVSPALGAFVAGVVLANSEYKRTLETDIQPFKGLLLGLFFISVGMSINFNLLEARWGELLGAVGLLIVIKAAVLLFLGWQFGLTKIQRIGFALALSQGGEFAFVLFKFASHLNVISEQTAAFYTLVVALSMATTPFIMLVYQRFIVPHYLSLLPKQPFDTIHEQQDIILVGYGRFGQIIGRFLTGHGIKLTILEKDPEQIKLLRKFGYKGYFGDAARLDLLLNAGVAKAKLLVIAVGNPDVSLDIVEMTRQNFPHLKIYARARNRSHAYQLHKAGVDYFKRETFDSSLTMAQEIMAFLGHSPDTLRRKAKAFLQLDEASLKQSFEFFEKEAEMISYVRQVNGELERILKSDQEFEHPKGRFGKMATSENPLRD
ncbi:potassium transporter [Legionella taurinensis]|uniref:Potassium transporter n=1 Tax=Legionella taurinensis TaxID=70611 RepID=A0A3A5LAC0_9GAMM|nr:monovalent cation:proton antiporter-2 (CPA2) family protein [Legionella taurinensis]MDX1837812.1 monovalent cation:proton antiporter-2 (CPA2) family protein [Legionella taurinensis]PUT39685.1 potassium transporter [Legionella taurinensis]PUT43378.1 potassium transporter [Legionella taurinensis]PUT45824.1 potassium transporter [Legionella taurinensis]PUT47736.1 potassium transporter [Legionella taurinensis]